MSFRNRILIAGGNGIMNLSVPLLDARNEKLLYNDIKIADEPWQRDHWRGIVSAYNRSPWFEYFRDDLAGIFEKHYRFLLDFNIDALHWVQSKLKLPVTFDLSPAHPVPAPALRKAGGDPGNADDFRNHFLPASRSEWTSGKDAVGMYGQVFRDRHGFIPGLSILDLLFCEGPAAVQWLRTIEEPGK
ncbi:WbqC family protein [Flavihumibacter petaseus]|nr:WbqC family protein [Flavihumibacter petaseus]